MDTRVVDIRRKQGYALEHDEIETITRIYQANNSFYTPTLRERMSVETDTDVELYGKLLERTEERIAQGYIFYLIYLDGKLIGFNNHRLTEQYIKGRTMSILEIGTTCINPDYHNMGIGSALYSLIDEDAHNLYKVEAVTRGTWSTNLRQCHLYEKHGYKKFLIKIDYYGLEGVDSISYYKELNSIKGD